MPVRLILRFIDFDIHVMPGGGLLVLGFFTIAAIQDGQAMEATPTLLTFTAEQGGPNPVTPAVIFLKNNTRERNWATSYNAAWLSVTVFPTNLIPSDQLLVSVNVVGLTAGVYTGTVSIAGMKGDPVSIPVILTITDRSFTTLPPALHWDEDPHLGYQYRTQLIKHH